MLNATPPSNSRDLYEPLIWQDSGRLMIPKSSRPEGGSGAALLEHSYSGYGFAFVPYNQNTSSNA